MESHGTVVTLKELAVLSRLSHWIVVVATCVSISLSGCSLRCWKRYDCPDPPAYDEGLLVEYADRGLKITEPELNVCEELDFSNLPLSPGAIDPTKPPEDLYWDLTLEEVIHEALQNSEMMRDLGGVLRNPFALATIYDPAITYTDGQFGEEAALSEFDAQVGARTFFEKNDRGFNNQTVGQGGFFRQDYHNYEVALSKRSATGGLFALRSVTQYDNNNQDASALFPHSWDTYAEAEVRQPLLQGAGVEFNRIAGPNSTPGFANGVLIARTRTDISLVDFEIGLRNLISDVENAYWDLYFAYRDLDAKIEARDNALKVWKNADADDIVGRAGVQDADQAREQYYRFESEVINALHGRLVERTRTNNGTLGGTFNNPGGVRVAERRLRVITGLPSTSGRLIRPVTEAPVARVSFEWDAVAMESVARRPELRRQKWVIKQKELELLANRNFLMPNLDVVARARARGFGQDLIGQNATMANESAFQSLTDGDFSEYQIGLEFNMPLGFRRGHAAVRSSELEVARARAVLRESERHVLYGLSNTYGDIDRAYQVMEAQFNRREAAYAQLAAVEQSFERGAAPIDLLLEAQRRVVDSNILFYQARVDYALAIKNMHFEKGSLMEFYNIAMAESPWPQKALEDALMRDLNKRRHEQNYILNDDVIGRTLQMTDTLSKAGETEVLVPPTPSAVPPEAPLGTRDIQSKSVPITTAAKIDRPAASPETPRGPAIVRAASIPNPLRDKTAPVTRSATAVVSKAPTVKAPTATSSAPVEAPIIRTASGDAPINFGGGRDRDGIWLH